MTTQTPTEGQAASESTPLSIADENLSFSEYEMLRRGETPVRSAQPKSAPEAEASEQKEPAESDAEGKEAEDESTEEPESEKDDGDAEDSEKDKPKKKGGFQRRIDKLNARYSAAQQEAEYWKAQALKGKGEPDAKPKAEGSKPVAADGKPNPDSFETHAEYVEALTDWKVKQELKERDQKSAKERLEIEQENMKRAHSKRVQAFAEKTKDFFDVLENLDDVPNSPTVEELVLSSDNGPEILYELAKNPKEAARIAMLSPLAAAREIGRIEAKISARASEEKKPEPKKLTSAPKPIEPVGGGKGTVAKSIDAPDLSFPEYERMRREQLRRKGA